MRPDQSPRENAVEIAESLRGRRLVGRLERGCELGAALLELCRSRGVRAAELRAHGALGWAELGEYDVDEGMTAPRRFHAPSTLLQLQGSVFEHAGELTLRATCTLSYAGDNGITVVGGYLVRGEVLYLDFVLETFDDLGEAAPARPEAPPASKPLVDHGAPARSLASAAAAPAMKPPPAAAAPVSPAPAAPSTPAAPAAAPASPAPAAPAAPAADPAVDWRTVIAASAEQSDAEEDEEPKKGAAEVQVQVGDVIDHPRLGRGSVERIEGDYEFLRVRLNNNGRLVRLSLDVLELVLVGPEGAHRRFRVVMPR